MAPPLFVYAIEVGMFQQARDTGEASCDDGRGLLYTPVGSVGGHQLTILHNVGYDYDDRY